MAYIKISPTMSSNTTPSPNVTSASSVFDGSRLAWKALDGNTDTSIFVSGYENNPWWQLDFGSALYAVSKYGRNHYSPSGSWDSAWTFAGSNDGTNWTTLDSRSGSAKLVSMAYFTFANTTAYRYYRLTMTAWEISNLLYIGEIEMFYDDSPTVILPLQTIPHSTSRYITRYISNNIEMLNISNRQRIGIVGSVKYNYIGV